MSDQQRINFDDVIQKESSYEVARYFLASLDLVRKIIRRQEKSELIHQFLTNLILLSTGCEAKYRHKNERGSRA